jgi:hypothetical protein
MSRAATPRESVFSPSHLGRWKRKACVVCFVCVFGKVEEKRVWARRTVHFWPACHRWTKEKGARINGASDPILRSPRKEQRPHNQRCGRRRRRSRRRQPARASRIRRRCALRARDLVVLPPKTTLFSREQKHQHQHPRRAPHLRHHAAKTTRVMIISTSSRTTTSDNNNNPNNNNPPPPRRAPSSRASPPSRAATASTSRPPTFYYPILSAPPSSCSASCPLPPRAWALQPRARPPPRC